MGDRESPGVKVVTVGVTAKTTTLRRGVDQGFMSRNDVWFYGTVD